jgi:cell division protein ZapA (FtsZ GTPase activity inhibitor)
MSELSIKVTIAGRVYPLTISSAEEELVRKASRQIDEQVKNLQQTYAVKDRQDLLAMVALQSATQNLRNAHKKSDEALTDKLLNLSNSLDSYLS